MANQDVGPASASVGCVSLHWAVDRFFSIELIRRTDATIDAAAFCLGQDRYFRNNRSCRISGDGASRQRGAATETYEALAERAERIRTVQDAAE